MSALNDLIKLAGNHNSYLLTAIDEYTTARQNLTRAHAEQSIAIRALAGVTSSHHTITRGQELELRAVRTLANQLDEEDS